MFPSGKSPLKSYYTGKNNDKICPSPPGRQSITTIKFVQKDYYNESGLEDVLSQQKQSWWSWTFAISTFPFILFGCPIHYLLQSNPPSVPFLNTAEWVKSILFSSSTGFSYANATVSLLLLFPTAFMNIYALWKFGLAFDTLYITAQYDIYFLHNCSLCVQSLLLVIPLDYVWLLGYKFQEMIQKWNQLYTQHKGVGCSSFRFRLISMTTLIICVFGIRYMSRLRHILDFSKMTYREVLETLLGFVLEFGMCLLLPLYCTFCYAVKFHLVVIKSIIYRWLSHKVSPNVRHLNVIKAHYTHASDAIMQINAWCYFYMSLVIPAIIWKTVSGSRIAFGRIFLPAGIGPFLDIFRKLIPNGANPPVGQKEYVVQTSAEVRELNLEVLGILIMIFMIYWTIWQAVKTNDCAREIHLWLNDFATGGSGANISKTLRELGVIIDAQQKQDNKVLIIKSDQLNTENNACISRVLTRTLNNGDTDELLEKFKLLKAYIHVKMELEDSALLNIAIIRILKPNLSGRLGRYRLMF